MHSHNEILREFIKRQGYASYLEIGIAEGDCYRGIEAEAKVGVDPWPRAGLPGVVRMKSDDFFAANDRNFDLCFVDGYHSMAQALRDAMNAARICKLVIMHDTMPPGPATATPEPVPGGWHGEVWKVCEYFRRTGVRYWTLSVDFGLTVVPHQRIRYDPDVFDAVNALPWRYFEQHSATFLNLVPADWLFEQQWDA
jgi:hypothetical protein